VLHVLLIFILYVTLVPCSSCMRSQTAGSRQDVGSYSAGQSRLRQVCTRGVRGCAITVEVLPQDAHGAGAGGLLDRPIRHLFIHRAVGRGRVLRDRQGKCVCVCVCSRSHMLTSTIIVMCPARWLGARSRSHHSLSVQQLRRQRSIQAVLIDVSDNRMKCNQPQAVTALHHPSNVFNTCLHRKEKH